MRAIAQAQEEKRLEKMSTDELRAEWLSQSGTEDAAKHQAEIEAAKATLTEDALNRRFEKYDTPEILEEYNRNVAREVVRDSPESQVEQAAVSAEQRAQDALYVSQQLEQQNNQQLDALVRQKVAEETAANQRSQQTQLDFVNSHPEYITDQHNGDLMRNWVRDNGYREFTPENLELAATVLRPKLHLMNGEQVIAKQQLQQTVQTGEPARTARRSSSVSTTRSDGNFYSRPVKPELSEEDLYLMDLKELGELAFPDGSDAELAEQKRGVVRQHPPTILNQF